MFSYDSAASEYKPAAHTFITSDPSKPLSIGQTLSLEDDHDDLETIKAEKKEIRAELKDLNHEETVLKKESSPNLSESQRGEFAAEQKVARVGESELLNRWMNTPTYAPVASLSDMKKAAVEASKFGHINSKEAIAKLVIKPPPGSYSSFTMLTMKTFLKSLYFLPNA